MRERGRRSSGTARLLVLAGILTILGVTFGAGVYTGRIWSARTAVVVARVPDPEPARRGPGRGGRLPETPAPRLTFYQELTAPLTAPPPAPKGAKPRAAEPAKVQEQVDAGATPAPSPAGDYTVQVGAYKAAAPAEALRATLAAAGWDPRVVAAEVADGVRYRVQVGTYPTRSAARTAAERLAAERNVPTLVTAR